MSAQMRSRRIVSILAGNSIQITGIVFGAVLLWISTLAITTGVRIAAMIAGYLLIYFNSHALLHYSIGKLVGIKFKHYSIGGSAHADSYPPLMRTVFARLPFFAAHTHPASLEGAQPSAQALMFAAGIAGTVLFSTSGALFAHLGNAPGGSVLLVFNTIWIVSSLIVEMRPSGDLGKAFKRLKKQAPRERK